VRRASRFRPLRGLLVLIPDVPFRPLPADVLPPAPVAPVDLPAPVGARPPVDARPRAAPPVDPAAVASVDVPAVDQAGAVASAAAPAVGLLLRDCAAGRVAVAVRPSDVLVVVAGTSKSSSRPRPPPTRRRMRLFPTSR
jgi:hypothetical protein